MRVSRLLLVVLVLALCAGFGGALVAQQALTDRQRIEQAQALLKPLEASLADASLLNLKNILTRLETLKAQLAGDTLPTPLEFVTRAELEAQIAAISARIAAIEAAKPVPLPTDPPPPSEICANGVDDDGDGKIDKADEDCIVVPQGCSVEPLPGDANHPYFAKLRALKSCAYAYDLRSEASLRGEGLSRHALSPPRLPVIYDPEVDAMVQRIEPGPVFTPGYGSIDAQQLHAVIRTPAGINGVLITFDFRMNEEWIAFIGQRSARVWNDASALWGWKSWRIDAPDGSGNFTLKTQHKAAVQNGPVDSVGVLTMHAQGSMTICGPTSSDCTAGKGLASWTDGSEVLWPRLDVSPNKLYFKPNTWVRVWMYFGGVIGNGARSGGVTPPGQIPFSLWYAEEGGPIFQAYNGTPVNTDVKGFEIFRFEFDASAQGDQPHGLMKVWGRNLAVLHHVTADDVKALLQAPVAK